MKYMNVIVNGGSISDLSKTIIDNSSLFMDEIKQFDTIIGMLMQLGKEMMR